jgi:hypothetical protein
MDANARSPKGDSGILQVESMNEEIEYECVTHHFKGTECQICKLDKKFILDQTEKQATYGLISSAYYCKKHYHKKVIEP